jgi:cytochrome c553
MTKHTLCLILFAAFAFGLPLWGMNNNKHPATNTHGCYGECYEAWKAETGGLLQVAAAKAAEKAAASPAELGRQAYAGCIACHGANGEGGVGPQLAGQSAADIADKLLRYQKGESIGAQSALMWSQAAQLSPQDIDNLAAFVESL